MNPQSYPIPHLSFSSMRCYMEDRQRFERQYIRKIYKDVIPVSMIEGQMFHRIIEGYWNSKKHNTVFDWEDYTKRIMIDFECKALKGEIDFMKTGSKESSEKTIKQAVGFYRECMPSYQNIVEVENTFLTEIADLHGEILPLKFKGVLDLIIENDGEIIMVDHKLVSSVVEQHIENPAYILQAAAYWFLIRSATGKEPSKMIFDQIKKTKNRDGGSQLYPYIVEITEERKAIFLELYRRIIAELPLMTKPIPNLFTAYGWEDSWNDFKEDVQRNTIDIVKYI